jgi:hypothetical protein
MLLLKHFPSLLQLLTIQPYILLGLVTLFLKLSIFPLETRYLLLPLLVFHLENLELLLNGLLALDNDLLQVIKLLVDI